jgi:hypothetical protein
MGRALSRRRPGSPESSSRLHVNRKLDPTRAARVVKTSNERTRPRFEVAAEVAPRLHLHLDFILRIGQLGVLIRMPFSQLWASALICGSGSFANLITAE